MTARREQASYRLLLVQDPRGDRGLRREHLLEVPGFHLLIDEAGSLRAASALAQAGNYDSLVIDLNLPDGTGLETLRELRRSCHDTPIVVLSGDPRETLREEVLREGAQDFLGKNDAGSAVLARAILYSVERNRADVLRHRVEQLRDARELEEVGQLAGGMVHDFNNALTVILASAEILLDTSDPSHSSHSLVVDIQDAGRRAAAITRQLLTLARRQVRTLGVLDVNTTVTDVRNRLVRLIGEDVRLTLELHDDTPPVRADADQIGQVLTNLTLNARDAMRQGGTIVIRTSATTLDERTAPPGLRPGLYAGLAVRDTGQGMSKDVAARVFEPFFTTKTGGAGLGLAMVHGFVTQSGGAITVESKPGAGTTFTILLPAADLVDRGRAAKPSTGGLAGHERILLVEDEAAVRTVAADMLTKCGYSVLAVDGGLAAIDAVSKSATPFDLVLTDVVMPDMSGWALGAHLLERRPRQTIIYMSGYSGDLLSKHGDSGSSIRLLRKPFARDELLRAVRGALDAAAGSFSA